MRTWHQQHVISKDMKVYYCEGLINTNYQLGYLG